MSITKRYSTQPISNLQLGCRLSPEDKQRLEKARDLLSQSIKESCSKDRSILLAGDAMIKIRHVLKNHLCQ